MHRQTMLRVLAAVLAAAFVASGVTVAPAIISARTPEATETLIVEVKDADDVDRIQNYTKYPVDQVAEEPPAIVEPPDATPQELDRFVEVTVPAARVEQVRDALEADPAVAEVEDPEPVVLFRTPNDPLFSQQWGLEHATDRADINATRAWDVTTGSKDLVVAVIDTGLDLQHPAFQGRAWTNPGEIPNNGIDDERNGFIDDVRGWDFYNNDNDPSPPTGGVSYHGTHVAGIIAATGNDANTTAGIDWNVTIMPVKVFGATGSTSTTMVARAISYAVANGASVVNLSLGSSSQTSVVSAAVRDAYRQGVVLVAARGNTYNQRLQYPACDDLDGKDTVLAVAALDELGNRAYFSSYGPCTNIAAPGQNILSTVPGGGTSRSNGTSFAAPHAAGVATLYRALRPGASVDEVIATLSRGDPLPTAGLGGGRLNAATVLGAPPPTKNLLPVATVPTDVTVARDGTGLVTFRTTLTDADSEPTRLAVKVRTAGRTDTPAAVTEVRASSGTADVDNTQPHQIGSRDPVDTDRGPLELTVTLDARATLGLRAASDVQLLLTPNDLRADGATVLSLPLAIDTAPPTGLASLQTAETTPETLRLAWQPATDVNFARYELWYGTDATDVAGRTGTARRWSTAEDSSLANATAAATTITGLTPGTTLAVRIWAVDAYGNEQTTQGVSATLPSSPGGPTPTPSPTSAPTPSAPATGLRVLQTTDQSATLSWIVLDTSDFDRYEVWIGTDRESVEAQRSPARLWSVANDPLLGNANSTSTTITGLAPRTSYVAAFFVRRASNDGVTVRIGTLDVRTSGSSPALPPPPPPSGGGGGGGSGGGGGGGGGGTEGPGTPPPETRRPHGETPAARGRERRDRLAELRRQQDTTERASAREAPPPTPTQGRLIGALAPAFRGVFGRNPTQSEEAYWRTRILTGQKNSLPSLVGSMAYQRALGRTVDPTALSAGPTPAPSRTTPDLVVSLNTHFRDVYGRDPTPSEHAYWLDRVVRSDITSALELQSKLLYHRVTSITH